METRAGYVAVGLFVIVLIAGLLVAALWLTHGQFAQEKTRYDTYFASVVNGLVDGSPVRISGVQVGTVVDVALDPNDPSRVRVTVEVGAEAPIRSNSVASIDVQALTGSAAIEITPGSKDAPPIGVLDEQGYAVIWSQESEIQQVVASIPEILAKVSELADRLGQSVDARNREALAHTLDNLNKVTTAVAAHSDDLEHLMTDAAGSAKALRSTIDALTETARQLTLAANEASGAFRDVDALVKENRQPLRDLVHDSLDDLRQLVAQTRTLVDSLTRTVDTINRDPSRFLYGDRRQGYRPQ